MNLVSSQTNSPLTLATSVSRRISGAGRRFKTFPSLADSGVATMRMLLDTFAQTLRTLWAHKLRSFLTMFGIAWGVGSLLLLAGVGEGFRNGNRKQLETFGKNIIFFFGGRAPAVEGSFNSMKWFNLTYDDYLAIKSESKLAINISPLVARDDLRAVSEYTSTNGRSEEHTSEL